MFKRVRTFVLQERCALKGILVIGIPKNILGICAEGFVCLDRTRRKSQKNRKPCICIFAQMESEYHRKTRRKTLKIFLDDSTFLLIAEKYRKLFFLEQVAPSSLLSLLLWYC